MAESETGIERQSGRRARERDREGVRAGIWKCFRVCQGEGGIGGGSETLLETTSRSPTEQKLPGFSTSFRPAQWIWNILNNDNPLFSSNQTNQTTSAVSKNQYYQVFVGGPLFRIGSPRWGFQCLPISRCSPWNGERDMSCASCVLGIKPRWLPVSPTSVASGHQVKPTFSSSSFYWKSHRRNTSRLWQGPLAPGP
jgi:hypothetical protein